MQHTTAWQQPCLAVPGCNCSLPTVELIYLSFLMQGGTAKLADVGLSLLQTGTFLSDVPVIGAAGGRLRGQLA